MSQDETIDARIAIDDTLARHFAIVGTTGVGKSTAVSLLMRKAIEARPDLRMLILDPHNEFAASLPEYSVRVDSSTLDLPFWMFRLEEFAEVLFRGREAGARRGRRAARPHPGGQEPLSQSRPAAPSCAAAAMR